MSLQSIETIPAAAPEELAGPPEAPVQRAARFATLDTLRGFALLGILVLNIEDFAGPEALWDIPVGTAKQAFVGWHALLDQAIVTLKWLFAEGKMRSLFAMLFGAGAVLLTERIEKRGQAARAAAIFYRRNLWLGMFGLIHGFLIWFGDILVDYAVLGLVFLYPLRRLGSRRLIVLGLTVWIVGGTFGSTRFFHVATVLRDDRDLTAAMAAGSAATPVQHTLVEKADAKRQEASADIAEEIRAGRRGYLAGWRDRVSVELLFLGEKFRSGWVLEWLGAMITGMGLYKVGYLTGRRRTGDYVIVAMCGYAISSPIVLVGLWHTWQAGPTEAAEDRWMILPYSLEVAAGALADASLLLLLLKNGKIRCILSPLSAVGRMAFSNYILTSVICKTSFSWGPWKLYGRLEYYQELYVVAAIWAINLTFSPLWLSRFAFGPLEWLWRSLTYWKRQPLLLRQIR